MRIKRIEISKWRNFEDVEIVLDDTARLICIVGANGSGKSHLLELIAACTHRLGISPGIDIPRGNPLSGERDVFLEFYIAEGISETIDQGLASSPLFGQWDRTLSIHSQQQPTGVSESILAGGIADRTSSSQFATLVIKRLQESQEVHFLSLDADRAYPKKHFNINQVAEAYEVDWAGIEYTRGRSFKTSTTLYDEWIKYFLALESQSGTRLMQDFRRAIKSGMEPPQFVDHFRDYTTSLQSVLPHVQFTGVNPKNRTLLFDTIGMELSFDQLSGGEREIAFLVGQIDRFGLRRGLFLLDEPELHLNADLIRTWVTFLSNTVSTGQVWLATHSLEAVEAAGQHATFVLERNEVSRKVDGVARLDTRPVLSALSRAVGTPAFSISQTAFVFIEGDENIGERERFCGLAGSVSGEGIRFMASGPCEEVLRRVDSIKALAAEAKAEIRIGGVIDRDFRSERESTEIHTTRGVFVLPVHEVENFFLHPATLAALLQQNGRKEVSSTDLIRAAADARAGNWVYQHAMAARNARDLPEASAAKDHAKALAWTPFSNDRKGTVQSIVDASGFTADARKKFQDILDVSASLYGRRREEDNELWKACEGKQVLNRIALDLGFGGTPALILATFTLWDREGAQIPEELLALRRYLTSLRPTH